MAKTTYSYQPDYAVPPGEILEEYLDTWGMSQAEFARRCGRSPKLISQIITGEAPIEPATALQFEKVSGMDARVWLGIEADYRLHRQRQVEKEKLAESAEWAKRFPVSELVKRGCINRATSKEDRVANLLSFFGVASVAAWRGNQDSVRVAYRHSPAFDSDEAALATWLRLGELAAEQLECPDYNEARFKQALARIRALTITPAAETIAETQRLCQDSGVVLAIIKPLPKIALSGVTRWLTPRKALVQLSARHQTDDHLWFSFFHEAAHILLHSKKDIFLDAHKQPDKVTEDDTGADQWASNFLIPIEEWEPFANYAVFNQGNVTRFAREQGIAPGIVVGRLQHERLAPWNRLNDLKRRLCWKESSPG